MLDASRPLFAFVRCQRVMTQGYLRKQEEHGSRVGPTAATRPDARRGDSLFWSKSGGPSANYVQDFRDHLKASNARTRQGAAIAVHLLIGVTPEWIAEAGGIHDGKNSRIQALFCEAKAFVEERIGGVFAVRLDLDELGGGIVDVYAAPVYDRKGRTKKNGTHGPSVREVSVKKSLLSMQKAVGASSSFSSMQTLWADHACKNLDPRLVRGVSRSITGRDHLTVPEYRESIEREKAHEAEMAGEEARIFNTLDFLSNSEAEISHRRADLDNREFDLDAAAVRLGEREAGLAKDMEDFDTERLKALDSFAAAAKKMEAALAEKDQAAELLRAAEAAIARMVERERGLLQTERNIGARQDALAHDEAALSLRETALTEREDILESREISADAKTTNAAVQLRQAEALAAEVASRETGLLRREADLQHDQASAIAKRDRLVAVERALEEQSASVFDHLRAVKESEIKASVDVRQAASLLTSVAARNVALDERERSLAAREAELNGNRRAAEAELEAKRHTADLAETAASEATAEAARKMARAHDLLNQVNARELDFEDRRRKQQAASKELERREMAAARHKQDLEVRERELRERRERIEFEEAEIEAQRHKLREEQALQEKATAIAALDHRTQMDSLIRAEQACLKAERLAKEAKRMALEQQTAAKQYVLDFETSLDTGLAEIKAGILKPATDLAKRPDLKPARDVLTRIIDVIIVKTSHIRRDYALKRNEAAKKTTELDTMLTAAAEREARAAARESNAAERENAAVKEKAGYADAKKKFYAEVIRLRRIRDWAVQLLPLIKSQSFGSLSEVFKKALRGLASEFGDRGMGGRGE